MKRPRMTRPLLVRVERVVRWALTYAATFCETIGRRNAYYWPGSRAGIATAHLVAHCTARGCDGVWYGHTPNAHADARAGSPSRPA